MATILYCEDNERIQKLFRIAFRGSEHEVLVASDGVEGLEVARARRPDLVVSDLAMPGLDGIELLKAIKADPELRSIPVVMISASTERHRLEGALDLGATAYFVKPFSPSELRASLERILGG
jgi:CheY-like chemotaxis protein